MKNITEQECKEYAEAQAATIVIRSYEDGNSRDVRRKTTKPEKKIIQTIIYGGLLALRHGSELDGVANACEFIGDLQLPTMNGYDTIYCPILAWNRENVVE